MISACFSYFGQSDIGFLDGKQDSDVTSTLLKTC